MFLFNSDPSLVRSFLRGTDSIPVLFLYSGAVPNTIEDVPFDIQNPQAAGSNADCTVLLDISTVDNDGERKSTIQSHQRVTIKPVKRSVMDTRRNMYRLAPVQQIRYDFSEEILNEIPTHRDSYFDPAAGEENETTLLGLNRQVQHGDMVWLNQRFENNGYGTNSVLYSNTRRSLVENRGIFMEFEQDVEVTHLEIYQQYDARFTSDQWTLEYFDETSGTWLEHETISGLDNPDENFIQLTAPITAKKFILSAVDTASSSLYVRYVSLLSTTEPYNVETIDLTWGLVYAQENSQSAGILRRRTDSFSEPGGYAVMLVDVGEVRDTATVTLNRSRQLPGFFNPSVLNFAFNIGADTGE